MRLALRDLARYQARSGAALAAASLAVGIAATIAITAAAQQAHDHTLTGGNLPTNQLIVWLANPNNPRWPRPERGARQELGHDDARRAQPDRGRRRPVDRRLDRTADSAATPSSSSTPPSTSPRRYPPACHPTPAKRASSTPSPTGPRQGWNQVTTPYVATRALLDLYRIPAGEIAPGSDILSSRHDLTGSSSAPGSSPTSSPPRSRSRPACPNYTSAPNTLITPNAMTAGRLLAVAGRLAGPVRRPLTAAQITDAQRAAAAAGITIETRTGPDHSLQQLRDYSTLAGMLVALGVLAMTVGLIRSETAGDLRTLAATGASSATRRTLNATSAAALALLGGILGTASGLPRTDRLALARHQLPQPTAVRRPGPAPLGLPAVAAIGAALFGRTPRALARRPLE